LCRPALHDPQGWSPELYSIQLDRGLESNCLEDRAPRFDRFRVPGSWGSGYGSKCRVRFPVQGSEVAAAAGRTGNPEPWNLEPHPWKPGTPHQEPRMAVVRNVAGNQGGTRRRRSKASARRRSTSHRNCPSRDRPWLDHSWRSVGITGTVPYLFIALRQPPPIRRPDRTRRSGRERSHRRSGSRSGGAPSCRPACRHEESRWMATRVDIR
jgi:hypothetical protein